LALPALDKKKVIGCAPAGGLRIPPVVKKTSDIGRNDPCPCGSGRKYKKCCAT